VGTELEHLSPSLPVPHLQPQSAGHLDEASRPDLVAMPLQRPFGCSGLDTPEPKGGVGGAAQQGAIPCKIQGVYGIANRGYPEGPQAWEQFIQIRQRR